MSEETNIQRNDIPKQPVGTWAGNGQMPAAVEPSTQRQTLDAWERFVTGEPLVATAVSKFVLSSWQTQPASGGRAAFTLSAGGRAWRRPGAAAAPQP